MVCGLLCALAISSTGFLTVLSDGAGHPLCFFGVSRLLSGLMQFLFLLVLSFLFLGFRAPRFLWQLFVLSLHPLLLVVLLGATDILFFAHGVRWIHPSLGVILLESWPALVVAFLSLFPGSRDRYQRGGWSLLFFLFLVYLGVMLAVTGYAGGPGALLGSRGPLTFLGSGMALLGALIAALSVVACVFISWRVQSALRSRGEWRDVPPGLVGLLSVVFPIFVSFSLVGLMGLLFEFLLPGRASSCQLSVPLVSYSLMIFLGSVTCRMVNVLGSGLGANALVYLGPPLGVLWLVLTVGAGVGRWDLFLLGLALVVGMNLLLQFRGLRGVPG